MYHVYTYVRQYDYEHTIHIPTISALDECELWPAAMHRQPGRPSSRARLERRAIRVKEMRCATCGEIGHNQRTCNNPSTAVIVANTKFFASRRPSNSVQIQAPSHRSIVD